MSKVTTPNSTVSNPEVDQIVNEIWSDEVIRKSMIEEFVLSIIEVNRSGQVGYFQTDSIEFLRPSDHWSDQFMGERPDFENFVGESIQKLRIEVPLHLGTLVVREIIGRLDSVVDHLHGSTNLQDFESYMDSKFEEWWSGDGGFVVHGWEWDYLLEKSMKVDVEKEVDHDCLNRSDDGLMMYESVPFSGVSVSHYEDGQLESKTSYSNGKWDGIHEWYYNNGQLRQKISFSNGEWDGPREMYFENGQLWWKGTYSNGVLNGLHERYFENGQLRSKVSYSNGKWDGIHEWYYNNGQLMTKGSYSNGELDGIWEEYHKDGQLESKSSYSNGEKSGEWYEDGETVTYPSSQEVTNE